MWNKIVSVCRFYHVYQSGSMPQSDGLSKRWSMGDPISINEDSHVRGRIENIENYTYELFASNY